MRLLRTSLMVAAACAMLAGCGVFGGKGKELSEEEKASRVSLSVLDQQLVADPSLAALSVTLPEARAIEDWPQAGRIPSKIVGHVKAGEAFKVDWKKGLGEGSSRTRRIIAAPVVEDGRLYMVDADQKVIAVDASNGDKVWEHTIHSDNKRDKYAVGAGIGLAGDRVIVTSGYGYIVALSVADGSELWRREIDTPISGSPAVFDGKAFVTSTNNELYVLDLATGDVVWTDQAIAESARILSSPSPAVEDDLLVAPFSSGELIAYVPANGRRLWQDTLTTIGRFTPLSAINDIAGRPSVQDGVVYAGSHSGVLTAIDARTGTRLWNLLFGSRLGPVISGDFLFIAGTDGQVACLRKIDGKVIWARSLPAFKNQKKKQKPIVYTGPLVASNRLILGTSRGELLALSPQTGETIDKLDLGQSIYIEPIAANGLIYVLTDDGTLVAIR